MNALRHLFVKANLNAPIMKTGFLLIFIIVVSVTLVSGKIHNGYESKLVAARNSLRHLHAMLCDDPKMSLLKKEKIRSEINTLVAFLSCYQLTEKLLMQLRMISPAIYNALDTITDKRGRPTDVYVRLVPPEKSGVPLQGVTVFSQASCDADANHSEYGDYSVAIKVWILDKSLLLLAHELGHARYVIPNLAEYCRFYARCYSNRKVSLSYIGHDVRDKSGKSADAFVRQYIRDKVAFKRASGTRPEPTFALLRRIERNNRRLREGYIPDEAVVSTVNR